MRIKTNNMVRLAAAAIAMAAAATTAQAQELLVNGDFEQGPVNNIGDGATGWTSYNFTQGEFADHVVRLDRDLHDWRATFTFVKSPNGYFLFNFNIALIAEPDLKFGYDQRNVK